MVTMAMVTLKNLFLCLWYHVLHLTKDELHSIKTHKIFFLLLDPLKGVIIL